MSMTLACTRLMVTTLSSNTPSPRLAYWPLLNASRVERQEVFERVDYPVSDIHA
jgi:hypothetical protein